VDSPTDKPATCPLIVTLALDSESQTRFEAERRAYFPPHLNRIPAHVSLFHALPGEEQAAVRSLLEETAARMSPFPVRVDALMPLGRGVAYRLRSDALQTLHAELRRAWLPWLTPQDRQGFRPHVVVQNKVSPADAKVLHAQLAAALVPWQATAAGLLLWHYEGGPWTSAGSFDFTQAGAPAATPAPAAISVPAAAAAPAEENQ
jgi:2'-5' RNA ligase